VQQANKALLWYQRAVAIWPYALDFQNKYGTCLIATGNFKEAFKTFTFIISENPNYQQAHTNIGYIYMRQGNSTMAYDHLRKAIGLDPDHEQTLINLAVWYHANNQDDKAKKALTHLLKKHPQNEQAKAMIADLEKI
jgi:Flp pilus assembly protein TadD